MKGLMAYRFINEDKKHDFIKKIKKSNLFDLNRIFLFKSIFLFLLKYRSKSLQKDSIYYFTLNN